MLPANTQQYKNILPVNKEDLKYKDLITMFLNNNWDIAVLKADNFITQDYRAKVMNSLGIKSNVPFYNFYLNTYELPNNLHGYEIYSLDQILENYQSQNWLNLFPDRVALKEKYPEAGKRYLQITSIEGEGSYFYDIETDCVYDVNWGQEENMVTGKLKPWFTSFYDFLEWYYGEDDEE